MQPFQFDNNAIEFWKVSGIVVSISRKRMTPGNATGSDKFIPKPSHAGGASLPSTRSADNNILVQQIITLKQSNDDEVAVVIIGEDVGVQSGQAISAIYGKSKNNSGTCVAVVNHHLKQRKIPMNMEYLKEALDITSSSIYKTGWINFVLAVVVAGVALFASGNALWDITLLVVAGCFFGVGVYCWLSTLMVNKQLHAHVVGLAQQVEFQGND